MALRRASSGHRFSANIWPGFVDALATLLMVLVFVLTIFTVMQSVLREQITDKDDTIADQERTIAGQGATLADQEQRLDQLGQRVAALSRALTVSEDREQDLQDQLAQADADARDRAARITRLTTQLESAQGDLAQARTRLTDFEAEVAALMAARAADQQAAQTRQDQAQEALAQEQSRASAAELAVAAARREIDAQAEQARLAAARRDALEAMIADLRRQEQETQGVVDTLQARTADLETQLSETEVARLTDAEAARTLRSRLESADAELTAMTLALEESRKRAEETLTLLVAAEAARDEAAAQASRNLTEAERQAALLATARQALAEEENLSSDAQQRVALLNEQVASLTAQLGSLQALLDAAGDDQRQAELRVENLGQQLNAALLRAAEETERRLTLEEQARQKAEEEARDLARYRSEFFGRLSEILSGREGVQVVGDRFVFQSEVLFAPGAATLSPAGQDQVARVAQMLSDIADQIPPEIDWIIRVDGHTDTTQLSGAGRYRDNWELSQARALAVVRYLIDSLGFPANRLAATGFADTRPVSVGTTPQDLAANRRIELKLTER